MQRTQLPDLCEQVGEEEGKSGGERGAEGGRCVFKGQFNKSLSSVYPRA